MNPWRLAVIGSPIAHSLSPRLHRAGLESLGLEGDSEALEVGLHDDAALTAAVSGHDALSVTMPLKSVSARLCDRLEGAAARLGLVNSLRVRDGSVVGRSTDGEGFLEALAEEFSASVEGRVVLVRGAGGAATALVDAVVRAGAAHVAVLARDPARTVALGVGSMVTVNPRVVEDVYVSVNTVPAGGPIELPEVRVAHAEDAISIDVVYSPAETEWLAAERRAGRRTANGLGMLVHQARRQMEWWFGSPIAVGPLWEAVR